MSEPTMTVPHLLSLAGVAPGDGIATIGLDDAPAFNRVFTESRGSLDVAAVRDEVVSAAQGLVARRPDVGAILLECSELPP